MALRTHSAPNQRTHYGFIVTEPAYRAECLKRDDPLAWWWTYHSDKPLLTALALYVAERSALASQAPGKES